MCLSSQEPEEGRPVKSNANLGVLVALNQFAGTGLGRVDVSKELPPSDGPVGKPVGHSID